MTSNSFKKGFTMMILKFYNGSLMMIPKRFKKVPQEWYQNSFKSFVKDGTKKVL